MEWRKSLTIRSIRVGPTVQQGTNLSHVVFERGVMQRSSPTAIRFRLHGTIFLVYGISR
jgi:hypothetical protein